MKNFMARKKFLILTSAWALAFVFALSLFSPSVHGAPQEGVDYITLAKPIPNMENTVIKVFRYDCPFCYRYDRYVIPDVVKILAKDGIKLTVWHLKTNARYGSQGSQLFASLITKDSKTGLGLFDDRASFKKAEFAYYKAYHDGRERWDGGAAAFLKTGLDAAGMTGAEFQKLLREPATQARLKEWEGACEIAKVQGVPAFVVKGRYLLYTKNIRSLNDMVTKIKELMVK